MERKTTVLEFVRMAGADRPHWGLPARSMPPRYLTATLIVTFVGLTAVGPSVVSAEALAGLFRQVMTIARAVHLAEQLREPPQPSAPTSQVSQSRAPSTPGTNYVAGFAKGNPAPLFRSPTVADRAMQTVADSRHFVARLEADRAARLETYAPLTPASPRQYDTRAADPDHAARVRQNMMVDEENAARQVIAQSLIAPDLVDIATVNEARLFLAHMAICTAWNSQGGQSRPAPIGDSQ